MEPLGPDDPPRLAGFRLIARLGEGGMGRVFLARSPGGRPVALKVIRDELAASPEFRERFVREVEAARAVSGVFTAPVLDADPRGNPAWLATGYVAGISLQETIDRFGPLPSAAVATLAAGLAEALVAVHAAGLVHRDLKPANVMLAADGPKLIDFGIARAIGDIGHRYTQVGTVIGSPAFLAPEQVTGTDVGPPADMFPLASVLVFALTGHRTFDGDGPVSVLYNVVNADPDLSGVPEEFLGVLRQCLAKDPSRRPTPRQLIEALDEFPTAGGPDDWQLPGPLTQVIMERAALLIRTAPATDRPPAPAAGTGAPAGDNFTYTEWIPAGSSVPVPSANGPGGAYALGVDLGTTHTAAAVWRDGRAEPVPLEGQSISVPSVLFLREDGLVLAGEAAARRGASDPERVARGVKRRFGDPVPLVLGGREATPQELTGHLLRWVLDTVARREGGPPSSVTVTHPPSWGGHRLRLMAEAAAAAALPGVGLLPEPVAATAHYASTENLQVGALVAVYDLGGGTFDATLVRRTASGYSIEGQPAGDETLGGTSIDQVVLDHVAAAVGPAWYELDPDDPRVRADLEQLRVGAIGLKETLSSEVEAALRVELPGISTPVRMTRGELESSIREPLLRTMDLLSRTIASAGVTPGEVRTVLLTGGSSRIPLVSQLIASELGIPVAVDANARYAVCLGAAIAAGAGLAPPPTESSAGPADGPAWSGAEPQNTGYAGVGPQSTEPSAAGPRSTGFAWAGDSDTGPDPSFGAQRTGESEGPSGAGPPPAGAGAAPPGAGFVPRPERGSSAHAGTPAWTPLTPPASPSPETPRRRRPLLVAGAVVAGLLVVAGFVVGGLMLRGSPSPADPGQEQPPATSEPTEPPGPPADIVLATIEVGGVPDGVAIAPDGSRAYVTDDSTDSVIVLDTASHTEIARIETPDPVGVVITPDGRVWVTNKGPGTVTAIDPTSNTPAAPIRVGAAPVRLVASADGALLYVTNNEGGSVSVVDTAEGTAGPPIRVGASPAHLSLNPDGDRLLVTRPGADSVTVVDTGAGRLVAENPVPGGPFTASFTPDGGLVYVSLSSAGAVAVIDARSNTVLSTIEVGSGPIRTVLTADGRTLYVTCSGAGSVSAVDTASGETVSIDVGENPTDAALDPVHDELYVTDAEAGTVVVLSGRG